MLYTFPQRWRASVCMQTVSGHSLERQLVLDVLSPKNTHSWTVLFLIAEKVSDNKTQASLFFLCWTAAGAKFVYMTQMLCFRQRGNTFWGRDLWMTRSITTECMYVKNICGTKEWHSAGWNIALSCSEVIGFIHIQNGDVYTSSIEKTKLIRLTFAAWMWCMTSMR